MNMIRSLFNSSIRKRNIAVIITILFFCPLYDVEAKMVDLEEAKKVACNFMKRSFGRADEVKSVVTFDTLNVTTMYAFNFHNGGYVLTSGSLMSDPILAYSETDHFSPKDSIGNENLLIFLEACEKEVINREQKQLKGLSVESQEKWESWEVDYYYPPVYGQESLVEEVFDLLYKPNIGKAVQWMQSGCEGVWLTYNRETDTYTSNNTRDICYNKMMPTVGSCEHAVAGCTPTALSQVMWKWEWPNSVSYTYKDSQINSAYTWDSMPPMLTVESTVRNMIEVSTLMRDCGYMLDAEYGCSGTSASNEYIFPNMISSGLIDYSAYRNIYTEEFSKRYNRNDSDTYPMSEWVSFIITDLIAGRPVIVASVSHAFVVSGFQKRDDGYYFYINYGWGVKQNKNGYYNLDFTTDNTINDARKSALIGLSPKKNNDNHEHDIHATCVQSTIGEHGKLSFYVENANSYILKIKYLKNIVKGYTSRNGVPTSCQYQNLPQEIIIDRLSGNVFSDGVVDVWYKNNVQLEYEYETVCDKFTAPTMYEVTFMNNYGQIVTYEGTFSPENSVITTVEDGAIQDEVSVYPNPSTGIINVSSHCHTLSKITIYDILGTGVKTFDTQNRTKYELDLSDCSSGCYYVAVETDESKIVKRIIIK